MPSPFPPSVRVLRPGDFTRALSKGRRRRDALLSVTASPNGLGHARLGLAVGRRAGNAPARNRIKRLLREAFRLQRDSFPPGFDYLVSPQGAPGPWRLPAMAESLLRLAKEAAR